MTDRISHACRTTGCYTLSVGTLEPAIVLPRLLDALATLAPAKHDEITAPGGEYANIPAQALGDSLSPWWGTDQADALLQSVIDALNHSAPPGFVCMYTDDDRLELARLDDLDVPDGHRAVYSTRPPHVSALRARIRPAQ